MHFYNTNDLLSLQYAYMPDALIHQFVNMEHSVDILLILLD